MLEFFQSGIELFGVIIVLFLAIIFEPKLRKLFE